MRGVRTWVVLLAASLPIVSLPAAEGDPIVLWKGLRVGMTPEEAVPVVQGVEGIKRAKVVGGNKEAAKRKLDIDYVEGNIPLADLPFQLGPDFEGGRLKRVFLVAPDQCEADLVEIAKKLVEPLSAKYDAEIEGPQELKRSDILEAEGTAIRTGSAEPLNMVFGSKEVAVILRFKLKYETPPSYPAGGGKMLAALWKLTRSEYDRRKAKCNGTGNFRMDVEIAYTERALYDRIIGESKQEYLENKRKLSDGL